MFFIVCALSLMQCFFFFFFFCFCFCEGFYVHNQYLSLLDVIMASFCPLFLQSVLGYDLRQEGAPHNCLDDARAAMKLVLAKLESKVDDVITEADENVRIRIFQHITVTLMLYVFID